MSTLSAPDQPTVTFRPFPDPAFTSSLAVDGGSSERPKTRLDQAKFWTGAALTAAVATLVGVLGLVVTTDVFHRTLDVVDGSGSLVVHTGAYALCTAVLALLAATLFAGIAQFAPRPALYFGWIGALGVVFAAVLPFTMPLHLLSQVIFASINALVGITIVVLLPVAFTASLVRPRPVR